MKLRWVEFDPEIESKTPVAMLPGYPECGPTYYKLQVLELCIDENGTTAQWVDVEIDYNG